MTRASHLALAAALTLGAALTARFVGGLLPHLDLVDPPLAHRPLALAPAGPRLCGRVVVLVLDGLGADEADRLPGLAAIGARGVRGVARSHYPTLTLPNLTAILTGVEPAASGVRSNAHPGPVAVDHVLARARAAGVKTAYVSDHSRGVVRLFPAFDHARWVGRDPGALVAGVREALAGDAGLIVVVASAVDDAGHAHGAASRAYAHAADVVDGVATAIARTLGPADTLIVVADHGHVAAGGHGGLEREVVEVPLILAGAGVRAGATLVRPTLRDVAPTVAALLGVPVPGHAQGRVLDEALIGASDVAAHPRVAAVTVRGPLVPGSIVALGFLGAGAVAAGHGTPRTRRARRRRALDGRILAAAVALAALPLAVAAGIFVALLRTPSATPSHGAGWIAIAIAAAGTVVAQVKLARRALAGRRDADRLGASLALFVTSAVLGALPVLTAAGLTASAGSAVLPGPILIAATPLACGAALCHAVSLLVLCGLELDGYSALDRRPGV